MFKTKKKALFSIDSILPHLQLQLIHKELEEGANHTQLTVRFEI